MSNKATAFPNTELTWPDYQKEMMRLYNAGEISKPSEAYEILGEPYWEKSDGSWDNWKIEPAKRDEEGRVIQWKRKSRTARNAGRSIYNQTRAYNESIRPPQSADERRELNRLIRQRAQMNRTLGRGAITLDHIYSLFKLGQDVWGLGPQLRDRKIESIEATHGPVGHRPQNARLVPAAENEEYKQAERAGIGGKPQQKAPMRFKGQLYSSSGTIKLKAAPMAVETVGSFNNPAISGTGSIFEEQDPLIDFMKNSEYGGTRIKDTIMGPGTGI